MFKLFKPSRYDLQCSFIKIVCMDITFRCRMSHYWTRTAVTVSRDCSYPLRKGSRCLLKQNQLPSYKTFVLVTVSFGTHIMYVEQ